MNTYKVLTGVLLAAGLASCGSDAEWHRPYDSAVCEELSVKIDGRDSLTQADYTAMIAQSEGILKYLIEKSEDIGSLPDSSRTCAWRELLADDEYLERFSYMFTLGSALYQADSEGRLDKDNKRHYADLDRYNERLAAISDRN
jgi:hypothetical protein